MADGHTAQISTVVHKAAYRLVRANVPNASSGVSRARNGGAAIAADGNAHHCHGFLGVCVCVCVCVCVW